MVTFRAKRRHWVFTIAGTVLIAALFILAPVWAMEDVSKYAIQLFGLGMVAAIIWEDWRPIWHAFLSIDNEKLSARVGKSLIVVHLKEIVAAMTFQDSKGQPRLFLATDQHAFTIPLRYLNTELIWQTLHDLVDSKCLGKSAYERWLEGQEFYQKAVQSYAMLLQDPIAPLCVKKKTWLTVLGWVGLAFYSGAAIWLWLVGAGGKGGLVVLIPLAVLSIPLIFPDIIEIDTHTITYIIPPFGRYRIRWDEVRWIEHSPYFDWMILHGKNKKLAMLGTAFWAGAELDTALALIKAQVQQKKIEMRESQWASFKIFSKNTRIR